MRRLLFTIVLSFLLTIIVFSQDENTLEYGDIVTAEITDREFELEYSFEGSEGDIVVILMLPVETLGSLNSPEILLLDADFQVIVDTTGNYSYGLARLVTQLPSDGSYTIIATRAEGRAGTSVGEFTLELIKPQQLVNGETISATASSEDNRSQYYLVVPTESSLISYELVAGDFDPQITITTLNEANTSIEEYINVNGKGLSSSVIGVLEEGQSYIILISKPDYAFYVNEVTADYSLTLISSAVDN